MISLKQTHLSKIACLAILIFLSGACSEITDLEITMPEMIKTGSAANLTITRTGSGSGEWDISDRDGFNYYFTSPAGNFEVEKITEKVNDYCHTTESNTVADRKMRNEVKREILIKETNKGEITIAIACHKPMYRFFAADSVVTVQMIIEDADEKVRDTVVFRIVR